MSEWKRMREWKWVWESVSEWVSERVWESVSEWVKECEREWKWVSEWKRVREWKSVRENESEREREWVKAVSRLKIGGEGEGNKKYLILRHFAKIFKNFQ